jgi:hypothetical protein
MATRELFFHADADDPRAFVMVAQRLRWNGWDAEILGPEDDDVTIIGSLKVPYDSIKPPKHAKTIEFMGEEWQAYEADLQERIVADLRVECSGGGTEI